MRIAVIAVSALVLAGLCCTGLGDYQVRLEVTGDSGLAFSGYYATTMAGLDSISGTIPASWTIEVKRECDAISVYLQKADQPGAMTGRMIVDDDTVQNKTVTNPSDAMHLFWQPGG